MLQSVTVQSTSTFDLYDEQRDEHDEHEERLHGNAAVDSFRSVVKFANASLQKSCITFSSTINQNIQQSDIFGNKVSTLGPALVNAARGFVHNQSSAEEVSFNYQLMSDE
jgi:hypothetical protein